MAIYQDWIDPICTLAIEAGQRIMAFYVTGEHETQIKDDQSPVTDADIAAHRIIVDRLRAMTPDIPVVSEESREHPNVQGAKRFWLVDPLDGTKSFIKRTDEFTVNIALIEEGIPTFGVIYIPAQDRLFYGSQAFGAYKQEPGDFPRKITVRAQPEEGLDVVVSMSHLTPETQAFLQDVTVNTRVQASSSLKFCVVAEGKADLYPRFGRTMEWDTGAGHAIVLAAGGRVETVDGVPLGYAKPDFANPGFIVYGGDAVEPVVEES